MNFLVVASCFTASELGQLRQQGIDDRAKAKLLEDEAREKTRRAESLTEAFQNTWQQLRAAQVALAETELAAAQSKKENKQLRQDFTIEKVTWQMARLPC